MAIHPKVHICRSGDSFSCTWDSDGCLHSRNVGGEFLLFSIQEGSHRLWYSSRLSQKIHKYGGCPEGSSRVDRVSINGDVGASGQTVTFISTCFDMVSCICSFVEIFQRKGNTNLWRASAFEETYKCQTRATNTPDSYFLHLPLGIWAYY